MRSVEVKKIKCDKMSFVKDSIIMMNENEMYFVEFTEKEMLIKMKSIIFPKLNGRVKDDGIME